MGRFRRTASEETADTGIDISPLMDCVFILLIFFIVTTVFVEETGVEVDRPQAASGSELEKTSILIAVTANGEVVYGGERININRVEPLVKRMLQEEEVPVIIQADQKSETGVVVRVIDQAKRAGAKVSIATRTTEG